MSVKTEAILSPSYFWRCVTFSDDCPFFSTVDPNLCYFVLGVLGLYGVFFLLIFVDLSFFWSLEKLFFQADYYINLVRAKVRRVQTDQRRLMSTHERTEKQLKRSQDSKRIITALRGALDGGNPRNLSQLTSNIDDHHIAQSDGDMWTDIISDNDF